MPIENDKVLDPGRVANIIMRFADDDDLTHAQVRSRFGLGSRSDAPDRRLIGGMADCPINCKDGNGRCYEKCGILHGFLTLQWESLLTTPYSFRVKELRNLIAGFQVVECSDLVYNYRRLCANALDRRDEA